MIASRLKAERFATDFLQKYYLVDPSNLDLTDILGAEGIFFQERKTSYSQGSLIRHKNSAQILVNSDIKSNGQKRFVIAHELGHWLMHPNIPLFNCDHTKFKYWNKEINLLEKEANWFASDFLMPKDIFHKQCVINQDSSSILSELADHFRTSLTATAIRFADHGIDPIRLAYCSNGTVRWTYASKDFKFDFYGKYQNYPQSSLVYNILTDLERTPERIDVVKTIDWFPNDRSVPEDSYLNEAVYPMPSYAGCLVVLWEHELNFKEM